MVTVALATPTELPKPQQLKPKPETLTRDVSLEPVTLKAGAEGDASKLLFDPVALKNKYLEERDKRLRANAEGVNQASSSISSRDVSALPYHPLICLSFP